MTTKTPTPAAVIAALGTLVSTMLVARAVAEVLREEVDGYKQAILDAGDYRDQYTDERITEPSDDWTMSDEESSSYLALLDATVRAAGHNPPEGFCPALMAESALRDAQAAMIKAAEPFFGVTAGQLLCGTKTERGLETHAKYLDLLTGLVVNAPGFTFPTPLVEAAAMRTL